MVFEAKALGHAALAADAAAKRDTLQIAGEIVIPRMIDAGQTVGGMAAVFQADEIAPMRAAVEHGVDLAVVAAGDDDRRLDEKGSLVIPRLGELAGQRQVLPARSEKDALKLGLLSGAFDTSAIARLKSVTAVLSEPSGDAALDEVLAEIELRAPVFKVYGEELDFVFTEVRKKGCRQLVIDGKRVDI